MSIQDKNTVLVVNVNKAVIFIVTGRRSVINLKVLFVLLFLLRMIPQKQYHCAATVVEEYNAVIMAFP